MKYSKPEVTLMGDAVRTIQSSSSKPGMNNDGASSRTPNPAYDLDE